MTDKSDTPLIVTRGDRITDISNSEAADKIGVQRFATAMRAKLAAKRKQGYHGWNTTAYSGWGCSVRDLEAMLRQHLVKGDVVDVANFCMMVWNRRNPRG